MTTLSECPMTIPCPYGCDCLERLLCGEAGEESHRQCGYKLIDGVVHAMFGGSVDVRRIAFD